ncbi:MAG: HlyD family efflux transporter periplasmic adaptor subunit, partial [Thermoguttaceae bacterium]|nr:HlyD family efflux transporter periplasmic adaptor subunit [Thermoguttaceae bacterium]
TVSAPSSTPLSSRPLANAASTGNASVSGVYEKDGRIVAPNALVDFPKGEGYEALISANGQGLLVELGLCEVDENGAPVVGEDGTTKRRPLLKGLQVRKGDVLGKQKDSDLVQQMIVAEQELLVATQELAVADKEAKKTLEVDVAEEARKVAVASYNRARSTNQKVPGSVSDEELQEKFYEAKRAEKAVEKAKFDLEISGDKVKVAAARVEAAKAQISAAEVAIENRKLVAPIDGVVDDVMKNEGEWLREGDEILKIVRLDKVQIKGSIPADRYAPEMIAGRRAIVKVERPGTKEASSLEGRVVYVSELVTSGHYCFYVDVVNRKNEAGYWLLGPGALVTVEICVDEPAPAPNASAPESSLTGSL